ncbi:lytic transglycosylase domain-containing protein [Roseateles noduli]|uniref:lytic transglycosylase domain-containing protein n=1 Tax=Roseateles noduli TaxID=2052484 RepID=UPI003D660539
MNDRSFVSFFRHVAVMTVVMHAADTMAQGIGATSVASAASFSAANDRPVEQVTRFRCTLIDGSTRLFIEDPRERHPGLADDCTLVRVAVAPLRPGASDDSPPWVGFSARLIQGPQGFPGSGAASTDMASFLRDAARPMPAEMASLVRAASDRHRLNPALVSALIFVESRYRADARSPKGAMGLMQLMPATAARYGVYSRADLLDPRVNVDIGVRHLRALHDRYDGRVDLILAAYNAGEGAVERFGQRVPPFPETEDYVRRITTLVGVPETAFTP